VLLSMITRTGAAPPALLASFVAPGAGAALLLLVEDRHPPISHTKFNSLKVFFSSNVSLQRRNRHQNSWKGTRSSTASHAVAHEYIDMRRIIRIAQAYARCRPWSVSDVVLLSWCEEEGRWSWDTRWYADHARSTRIVFVVNVLHLYDRRISAMLLTQQLPANQALPLLFTPLC
jgi:hypothetical protein